MTNSRKRRMSASGEDSGSPENACDAKKQKFFVLVPSTSTTTTTESTAIMMQPSTSTLASDGELEKLQGELARMRETVEAQNKTIEKAKQGLRCNICLETLRLPQLLAPCGHVACYGCLKSWFLSPPNSSDNDDAASNGGEREDGHANGNNPNDPAAPNAPPRNVVHVKKHCPYCRVAVLGRPIPVYALRDIVDAVDPLTESAPNDTNLPSDLWKDIFPPEKIEYANDTPNPNPPSNTNTNNNNNTRRLRLAHVASFYDSDDRVRRCGLCMHEIWGHMCSNERCRTIYDDSDESDSNSDSGSVHHWDGDIDPLAAWHGFHPHTFDFDEDDDNSYESSFVDDDIEQDVDEDEDDDGGVFRPVRFWPNTEESSTTYHTEPSSSEPRRPSSTSRIRPTSLTMEDEGDDEDGTCSTRSSEDFVSRTVLKDRSRFVDEDEEDTSTAEDWNAERFQRLGIRREIYDDDDDDDDGIIHEDDSEEETVSSIYGAKTRVSSLNARRRMIVSDENEDEDDDSDGEDDDEESDDFLTPSRRRARQDRRVISDSDEEDDDEDEDEDEELITPSRSYTRQRGRRIISEGDEEEDEEDEDEVCFTPSRRSIRRQGRRVTSDDDEDEEEDSEPVRPLRRILSGHTLRPR